MVVCFALGSSRTHWVNLWHFCSGSSNIIVLWDFGHTQALPSEMLLQVSLVYGFCPLRLMACTLTLSFLMRKL